MKKSNLILLAVILSVSSYSQSFQKLSDKTWDYFDQGDYVKSLEYAEKTLNQAEKEFGKNSTEYPSAMFDLAVIEQYNAKYNVAESHYMQALKLAKEYNGTKSENYVYGLELCGHFYSFMGNYKEAEKYYAENVTAAKEFFGKDHEEYARSLSNLAFITDQSGSYTAAIALYAEARDILDKKVGKDDHEYASTIINLGMSYQHAGLFVNAEENLLKGLAAREKEYGKSHPKYAEILNFLGNLYSDMSLLDKAEELYTQSILIREKNPGVNSGEYATSINNMALLYQKKGNYITSEEYYLKAVDLLKRIYGDENTVYLSSLNNLAGLYHDMGKYSKSEQIYLDVLSKKKKVFGEKSGEYAYTLNDLGLVYQSIGKLEKSKELFETALALRKSLSGENTPDYVTTLQNLSKVYSDLGEYSLAEEMLQKNLQIREKIYGKDNPDYALGLSTLAELYGNLGQFQNALTLFNQASEIVKKTLGEKHMRYAYLLGYIAGVYRETYEYDKAIEYYLASYKLRRELVGDEHPAYGSSIYYLAFMYSNLGEYEKAEPLYLEALAIAEKTEGKNSTSVASTCNNLALVYDELGKYSKAETYYLRSLEINKNTYGNQHPLYATTILNLASLYVTMGDFVKAEPLYLEANKLTFNQIDKYFAFLSETEKAEFLETVTNDFEGFNSYYYIQSKTKPELAANAFNNSIKLKGLLLGSGTDMRQQILNSKDTSAIRLFNHWLEMKQDLATLYTVPATERTKDVVTFENEVNAVEKELSRKSAVFKSSQEIGNLDWKSVKASLKPNEAVVEFISFEMNYQNIWDSIIYCALVLKSDYAYPKLVYLFEEKQLDNIVKKKSTDNSGFVNQLYLAKRGAGAVSTTVNINSVKGDSLYYYVWKKIEPSLTGVTNVYISPSGLLNQISFAAIPEPDGKYISDKYNLLYVSNSRNIAETNKKSFSGADLNSIAVYGGIQYDVDTNNLKLLAGKYKVDEQLIASRAYLPDDNSRNETWGYLKGTLDEANSISNLLNTNKKRVNTLTGKEASEESFKTLTGIKAPDVIHVATHGFFFPDVNNENSNPIINKDEVNVFKASDNPLLRSGLLFAGANGVWKGGKNVKGVDDGILTAYEVSNMDLSATRLAVMSACETGLGDLKGSEGVYGLQRAFKIAGVEYIIMSLWQVPDKETVEFMQLFYSAWLTGKDITVAFNEAQSKMRAKYSPYYWAAFVLIR